MSRNEPFVSIVVPVYNGERFLRDCLGSVLAQTYANWECVVVDNASTDGTASILDAFVRQDSRIRVIRNARLLPAMQNQNLAMRATSAHSKYTQMLHADDRLAPDCLEKKVAVGERHPGAVMIGSNVHYAGPFPRGGLPAHRDLFPGAEVAALTLLGKTYPFLAPTCLLLRSDVVRVRDPFYPDRLNGDLHACYEILQHGDLGFVHEPLVTIGYHDDSLTNTLAKPLNRLIAQNLELLTTYGPRFLTPAQYDARLEDRLDHYYRFLALALLQKRGADFWRFHRSALAEAGQPLSQRRLLRALRRRFTHRPLRSLRLLLRLPFRVAHAETT